jgi:hypothetical protein
MRSALAEKTDWPEFRARSLQFRDTRIRYFCALPQGTESSDRNWRPPDQTGYRAKVFLDAKRSRFFGRTQAQPTAATRIDPDVALQQA